MRDYFTKIENETQAIREIEHAKNEVIKNMETYELKHWETNETITPDEHFNNIVKWCEDNIYHWVWSNKKSVKYGWSNSYGAKHYCERTLKRYVANNWIKVAMIYAGLEVCCLDDMFPYDDNLVYKPTIMEFLIDENNFICRKPKNKNKLLSDIICVMGKEYEYVVYDCNKEYITYKRMCNE